MSGYINFVSLMGIKFVSPMAIVGRHDGRCGLVFGNTPLWSCHWHSWMALPAGIVAPSIFQRRKVERHRGNEAERGPSITP